MQLWERSHQKSQMNVAWRPYFAAAVPAPPTLTVVAGL